MIEILERNSLKTKNNVKKDSLLDYFSLFKQKIFNLLGNSYFRFLLSIRINNFYKKIDVKLIDVKRIE